MMRKILHLYFLLLVLGLVLLPQHAAAQTFVHRDNSKIVDIQGNELIFKGMGLGGYMIQEGYMMETSGIANTQHDLRKKIVTTIGESATATFYEKWLTNHCTKSDVDSLAKWGFNCIRLPLHYNLFTLPVESEPVFGVNTWLTDGFTRVDNLLSWCEADHIYLILDLHAAPGGQGHDAGISDYDFSKPSLWESSTNQSKTVALWKKLAERYASKQYIGGYDLLNEPNWDLPNGTLLKQLYVQIIAGIRSVDKNHMVFIEGNWFANDFTGLLPAYIGDPLMDENMAYSFHKYWNGTETNTIQWMLDIRSKNNVPIWMGESGENSNEWFCETIKMLEMNNVGWSWWPLKKLGSVAGTCTIKETADYKTLLTNWQSNTATDAVFATNALMQIAENAKIENCVQHPDVIDAMFRQVAHNTSIPFKSTEIPGTIYLSDYDLGSVNTAYWDADFMNNGVMKSGNLGNVYRNDGVDIEVSQDTEHSNGYDVGWVNAKEWMTYTTIVKTTGVYDVTFRIASPQSTGKFHLEVNGTDVTGTVVVNNTGGWQTWKSYTIQNIPLTAGSNILKFKTDQAEFNASSMTWTGPTGVTTIPCRVLSAYTNADGTQITAVFNKDLSTSGSISASDFALTNGSAVTMSTVTVNPSNTKQLIIQVTSPLMFTDILQLSYNGSSITSSENDIVSFFSNLPVTNNLPVKLLIPGQVEAEDFSNMNGLSLEACSDINGGTDVGYTDPNDFMEYEVYVAETGQYTVDIRYSSPDNNPQARFALEDNGTEQLFPVISLPATGDFNTWKTYTTTMDLTKGDHTLRYIVITSRFNSNYFKFTSKITGVNTVKTDQKYIVFPNPASTTVHFHLPGISRYTVEINNINGKLQLSKKMEASDENALNISNLVRGMYMIKIASDDSTEYHKLIVE